MNDPAIHHVFVYIDGSVGHLHDSRLTLTQLGPTHIRRASHVEPAPDSRSWHVTLPESQTLIAAAKSRDEALQREVYLLTHEVLPHKTSAFDPL
jgi:hypothetical protein